jgi:hypothetical protein
MIDDDTTVPAVAAALRIDDAGRVSSPSRRFDEADCAKFERQHRDDVAVGQFGQLLEIVTPDELAEPPHDDPPAA